jgi:hypothetical protein
MKEGRKEGRKKREKKRACSDTDVVDKRREFLTRKTRLARQNQKPTLLHAYSTAPVTKEENSPLFRNQRRPLSLSFSLSVAGRQ